MVLDIDYLHNHQDSFTTSLLTRSLYNCAMESFTTTKLVIRSISSWSLTENVLTSKPYKIMFPENCTQKKVWEPNTLFHQPIVQLGKESRNLVLQSGAVGVM